MSRKSTPSPPIISKRRQNNVSNTAILQVVSKREPFMNINDLVKYISENPNKPCRVFGIGRVFRNESIDRTHLPEFHQIEGIIMEPGANLPMLVTTLKTFYEKMGYPEVRVRPAYFPYTEPSLEVEEKWRGQWL